MRALFTAVDVSGWVRRRLREHLAARAGAFSFVIPDGIAAELAHEDRVRALLDGIVDLIAEHEHTPTALFEVERASAPDDDVLALRFTCAGAALDPTAARVEIKALAREAKRFGADVRISAVSNEEIAVVVTLPLA